MCTEPLFGGLEEWGLRELPLDPAPLSVPNLDRCSTRQFAQLSGDAAARGTREPVRAGARVAPVSPYQGSVSESMPAADPAGDPVSDCRRFRSRLLSSCESSSSRCIRKISRSTCSCRAEKPAAATWARSLEPVGTLTRLGAALPSLGGSWLSVCQTPRVCEGTLTSRAGLGGARTGRLRGRHCRGQGLCPDLFRGDGYPGT